MVELTSFNGKASQGFFSDGERPYKDQIEEQCVKKKMTGHRDE
jgi:hypothetical protein